MKRLVGAKRETFDVMVKEYTKEEERKKGNKIGVRKPKLCEEDRVLFMIEYYREYRTLSNYSEKPPLFRGWMKA